MAREEGVTGIIGQVLDYPTSCHPKFFPKDKYELESYDQHYDASVVNSLLMETFLDAYDPDPKPDWRHSPLLVDSCKGLPPACTWHFPSPPLCLSASLPHHISPSSPFSLILSLLIHPSECH